jgi:hypothetical protein
MGGTSAAQKSPSGWPAMHPWRNEPPTRSSWTTPTQPISAPFFPDTSGVSFTQISDAVSREIIARKAELFAFFQAHLEVARGEPCHRALRAPAEDAPRAGVARAHRAAAA